MTNEEAIAVLRESKRQNEVMRDNPTIFWKSVDMESGIANSKKRIKALDIAIGALRNQPTGSDQELAAFLSGAGRKGNKRGGGG